jgi:hypothetical protein
MALTGDADGPPLVAPDGIVRRVAALGDRVGVDALALLGERAALAGLARRGTTSCGGATRLLPAVDGWLAVSLARPDDVGLLPAWFGRDLPLAPGGAEPPGDDVWKVVADEVAARPVAPLVAQARLLGLPAAGLPERSPAPAARDVPARRPGEGQASLSDPPHEPRSSSTAQVGRTGAAGRHDAEWPGGVVARQVDGAPGTGRGAAGARVVDLSSLWAGPLCAHLLGLQGADVVKVESTRRPDGARWGPAAFYDLLHAGHRSVALDLATPAGRDALQRLLSTADAVIEASRPRALRQMGIDAQAALRTGAGPRVWVSITGHGREGDAANAVAFGDDAAVAGGLVAWGGDGRPRFVADAVADPLSGLAAAGAALDALAAGGRWLLDVAMAAVAAHVAGPDRSPSPWAEGHHGEAAPPRARPLAGTAASLGAHTAEVLAAAEPA